MLVTSGRQRSVTVALALALVSIAVLAGWLSAGMAGAQTDRLPGTLTVDGQATGPMTVTVGQTLALSLLITGVPQYSTVNFVDVGASLHSSSAQTGSGYQIASPPEITPISRDAVIQGAGTLTYATSLTLSDADIDLILAGNVYLDLDVIVFGYVGEAPTSARGGGVFGPLVAADRPPVARDQSVTTAEDTVLAIPVDASDPDGDRIRPLVVSSNPEHGTISISGEVITYTPNVNYHGPDSLRYAVFANGVRSNDATVSITVTPVDDPFVVTPNPITFTFAEDGPSQTVVVTGVSADSPEDIFATAPYTDLFTAPATNVRLAEGGGFAFDLTVTPRPNAVGTYEELLQVYFLVDGREVITSVPFTVTITAVNDAPVAANDTYVTNEDTALTVAAPGVLGNDSDVDTGTTLSAALVAGPSHGSLVLNQNGSFTYIPAANFSGTDSFTYTTSDGTATSNVATATITVAGTNDAPVIDPASVPAPITAAQTGPAGASVTYPTPTATDSDGDRVTVTCAPASGSTFAPGTTTVTCTARDGNGGEDVETFTVTVSDQGAPVFTGLPNVTVGATSNYGAVVTYALPTATDNATTPTVVCNPASGSQFRIGTTTVTCTASDGVNVTTGTFTVTVTNNGFRDPRDPRPGASPQTQPPPTPTPRPARPPRG